MFYFFLLLNKKCSLFAFFRFYESCSNELLYLSIFSLVKIPPVETKNIWLLNTEWAYSLGNDSQTVVVEEEEMVPLCKSSGFGHVLADSLVECIRPFPVFALLTLPSISKEYEAFTDLVPRSVIGISNRKLQKFTKIIRELQLAPKSFISESCLEVNPVL